MIGFKKRDTKDLLKTIARQHGISVKEVRAQMQHGAIQTQKNRQSSVDTLGTGHLPQKNLFMW